MTVREEIFQALIAAANAGVSAPDPLVEEDRGIESLVGDHGAITASKAEDLGERISPGGAVYKRTLIVTFSVRTKAAADNTETAGARLEPLLERLTAKLGGSRLGGLVLEALEPRIKFEVVQGDVRVARATVFVAARYQQLVNDATRRV